MPFEANVHDDGLSPSVMKALATEEKLLSLLRVYVAIFLHGKDGKKGHIWRH